jgi:hypothetical protein
MGAVVLSLDEARERRRARPCPDGGAGHDTDADPEVPRDISDEEVLAGEL